LPDGALMEEIAEVYARSLFEVAKQHDELDTIREQLGQFADALHDTRELAVFFFSPYFSSEEKKDGLRRMVQGAEAILMNFLEALIERHRMPALFRIRTRFDEMWEHENRRLPVQVTSAVELDEQTVRHIGDRIGEQTGQTVDLSSHVDPEILGGIVLRVGNFVLDASIQNRLNQLRKQVAQA
jgi:ATP synthase F1 delta subunit